MWYIVLTLALVVAFALIVRKAFKDREPVAPYGGYSDTPGSGEEEQEDGKGDDLPINQ